MKNLISVIILIPTLSFSQYQGANWFFGDSVMLTFLPGGGTTAQQVYGLCYESSASISDSFGNLLFYTNGENIWNAGHEIMPNGCCINIDQAGGGEGSSVTQGVIILNDPGDKLQYYVFTLGTEGLYYSKVDMSLGVGTGDVTEKNILLFDHYPLMEKMHAVKHGNGRDWWLLIHDHLSFPPDSNNVFYEFLITPDEIIGPIEQDIGVKRDWTSTPGQMIFSRDGSRLAMAIKNNLEVFDFDRCTGLLSNSMNVTPAGDSFSAYGCSFSEDGNKVYISNAPGSGNKLFQYCFNCNESFPDTKKLIFQCPFTHYVIGQHQLGHDGRIYIALAYYVGPNTVFSEYNMNLCTIDEPDLEGPACNFDTLNIYLGGRRSTGGLPDFPNYNLGPLIGSACDTLITDTADAVVNVASAPFIGIYPNPPTSWIYVKSNAKQMFSKIVIYDIMGAQVKEFSGVNATSSLYVGDLPNGIYLLQVKEKDTSISYKLIIQK